MEEQAKNIVEEVSAMIKRGRHRQAMEMTDEQVADHQHLLDGCQVKRRHLQEQVDRQKEQG